eukprot:m.90259 g.90259  ORF g.90259 m.90259 type:complete len:885 (-) comp13258_c0_seq3:120-2774(-)
MEPLLLLLAWLSISSVVGQPQFDGHEMANCDTIKSQETCMHAGCDWDFPKKECYQGCHTFQDADKCEKSMHCAWQESGEEGFCIDGTSHCASITEEDKCKEGHPKFDCVWDSQSQMCSHGDMDGEVAPLDEGIPPADQVVDANPDAPPGLANADLGAPPEMNADPDAPPEIGAPPEQDININAGAEFDNQDDTCKVGEFEKFCGCQGKYVESRAVLSGEFSHECPELVRIISGQKKSKNCKPETNCQARAVEVAVDTLNHGISTGEDRYMQAARAFRLAGGLGISASVVPVLEQAKQSYHDTFMSKLQPGKRGTLQSAHSEATATAMKILKEHLPKNNPNRLMAGLQKYFLQTEASVKNEYPSWTEVTCHMYKDEKACDRDQDCGFNHEDHVCHDVRDKTCLTKNEDECSSAENCQFDNENKCRFAYLQVFQCHIHDGNIGECKGVEHCMYSHSTGKCSLDCSRFNAEECFNTRLGMACSWNQDHCVPSDSDGRPPIPGMLPGLQKGDDGVDMEEDNGGAGVPGDQDHSPDSHDSPNLNNRHPPPFENSPDLNNRHPPFEMSPDSNKPHEQFDGHPDMHPPDDLNHPIHHMDHADLDPANIQPDLHMDDICQSLHSSHECLAFPECHWYRGMCVHAQHQNPVHAPQHHESPMDVHPPFNVAPQNPPLHDLEDQRVSSHSRTATGDALFFVVGVVMSSLLLVLAFVSACGSRYIVTMAALVDGWCMCAFYWIDVRLPYNIDHYEHSGLNYDAFAIACIILIIFAGVRIVSAIGSMIRGDKGSMWQRLDILTIMALTAQLAILCVHVVTTKHASRTVIGGFIATILSGIVQVWFLIQEFQRKANEQVYYPAGDVRAKTQYIPVRASSARTSRSTRALFGKRGKYKD